MSELLFFLLLVLLPTQLGVHVWPSWALVLGRRIDYLSPTLYLTDIIIILLFVSWIAAKQKISHFPIFKTVLFFGFIFLNIFFAANHMVAFFAWIKILEFIGVGIYIVTTKPKFSSLIFPLSVGVFYSSVIAIVQFFLQHSIGGPFWLLGERTFSATTPGIAQIPFCLFHQTNCPLLLRSYATFSHPNVLGGFLAVLLPLIVIQLTGTSVIKLSDTKKIFYLATALMGSIALFFTFSRSAWIVCVIGCILALIAAKKNKLFIPAMLISSIIFFVVGSTVHVSDESVVVREQLNTAAIAMIRVSPIIGNGMGNFLVQLPGYLVSRQIYFLQPVHNIYLLILSETGVVGFVIFLWFLWKAFQKNNFTSIRYSVFAILLLGFVDHYFFTLQQGQLLFTIFLSLSLSSRLL